jgi:hypothetical protein
MLFVLNRIDVFRNPTHREAGGEEERVFCDRVTLDIQKRIRESLSEYRTEADSIRTIPLSSEPAFYAELASRCDGKEQAALLADLEDQYKILFSRDDLNSLPRDTASWTEAQRHWFIQETRVQSRVEEFEKHLAAHVAANLPEILLPDLVNGIYHPARQVLESLDALVEAYEKKVQAQLDEVNGRLDELYAELRNLQKEALIPLDPLREIATGDGGLIENLLVAVPKVEESLGIAGEHGGPGQLAPLWSALSDAVQVPLQMLNDFVYRLMEGEDMEDQFVDGCAGAVVLREAIDELRASPFGLKWKVGGSFEEGDAERVKTALKGFATKLSKVAEELVKREAWVQADRMKVALDVCAAVIVDSLERKSTPIVQQLGFSGLQGVFRGEFELEPPLLPRVKFKEDVSEWTRVETRYEDITVYRNERVWWKLWLGKSKVKTTKSVKKTTTRHGINVSKFGDLLEGFSSNAGVQELGEFFGNWLATSVKSFEKSLEKRLKGGVKTYRRAFEERKAELERGTQSRIDNADSYRAEVNKLLLLVDESLEWRDYAES